MMPQKLVTLNVNGLADLQKRTIIFNYLKMLNADIYALQETHNSTQEDETNWSREWGGKALWSRGTRRSRGTAFLFRPSLDIDIETTNRDHEGRVIASKIFINGIELNIMNIYAPTRPEDRSRFFRTLYQFLTGNVNLLIGGDFNCVPDLTRDKMGGNPQLGDAGIRDLNTLMTNQNLYDIWRTSNPQARVYTWHNRDFTIQTRLARWYVPVGLDATEVIRACPHSVHNIV